MLTFKNLAAGTGFLVAAIASSIWLFNKNPETGENKLDSLYETITGQETTTSGDVAGEEDSMMKDGETVEVLPGEGLYAFSMRVCGSGDFYTGIAQANDLDSNASLEVGQMLKVSCETFGINK